MKIINEIKMQQIILDLLHFLCAENLICNRSHVYEMKEKHYIREKGIFILQSKSIKDLFVNVLRSN